MAEARVTFYFGVPFYDYNVGPGYMYDQNYGWYHQDYRWNMRNQNEVCLVTFFKRNQVSGGADVNVQRARVPSPHRSAHGSSK